MTDNQGRILERFSYDAWGKRRNLDGSDDQVFDNQGLGILPSLSTHHGFTGHEMLDDMTLVHMNGRLYDPIIARFISADPHIDGLYSTQGLNSYSYVHNNPLNAIDPSGYFLKKLVKKIVGGVKKAVKSVFKAVMKPVGQVIRAMGPLAQPLVAIGSAYFCSGAATYCFQFIMGSSFATSQAYGASFAESLRLSAISGATAWVGGHLSAGIHKVTENGAGFMQKVANVGLHGLRGGATSAVSGGDFRSGFMAGSFGAFGDVTELSKSNYGAALFGGIGAKLGGGSFAEGAIIAVIGRRFNHDLRQESIEVYVGDERFELTGTNAGAFCLTQTCRGRLASGLMQMEKFGELYVDTNSSQYRLYRNALATLYANRVNDAAVFITIIFPQSAPVTYPVMAGASGVKIIYSNNTSMAILSTAAGRVGGKAAANAALRNNPGLSIGNQNRAAVIGGYIASEVVPK